MKLRELSEYQPLLRPRNAGVQISNLKIWTVQRTFVNGWLTIAEKDSLDNIERLKSKKKTKEFTDIPRKMKKL